MIKNVRVDHRLVHGQVAFAWTKALGSDCILVAGDKIAGDELRMAALRMAKPAGVKLVIKNVEDSAAALNSGVTDKYSLFVVTESIEDVYRLSKLTPAIRAVTLGGVKLTDDRRQISKAVSVSEEECAMIREMADNGVKLEIRMVPDEPAQDPLKLI